MGKKNKKSFYKKNVRPFVKSNKLLLSALGGVAAGITLAKILGTEKAHQILHTVEDSISNFTDKVANQFNGPSERNGLEPKQKKQSVPSQ